MAADTGDTPSLTPLRQCGHLLLLPNWFISLEKTLTDMLQWGHFIFRTLSLWPNAGVKRRRYAVRLDDQLDRNAARPWFRSSLIRADGLS